MGFTVIIIIIIVIIIQHEINKGMSNVKENGII